VSGGNTFPADAAANVPGPEYRNFIRGHLNNLASLQIFNITYDFRFEPAKTSGCEKIKPQKCFERKPC
jgi:hypothetical protein